MKRVLLAFSLCVLVGLAVWLAPWKSGGSGDGKMTPAGGSTVTRSPSRSPADGQDKMKDRAKDRPAAPGKTEETLQDLISELANFRAGLDGGDNQAMERISKKLNSLDVGELLAVIQALKVSKTEGSDKLQLMIWISATLSAKDPELALDESIQFSSGKKRHLIAIGQVERFYTTFASKDPAAAAAWLDRQISAGTLAEEKELRARFEVTIVRALAATDPAVAAARFARMDEAARSYALKADWFSGVKNEKVEALASFFREVSGPDDSSTALVSAASNRLQRGGLTDAATFIGALDASPDERASLVGETLRRRISGQVELLITPEETVAWIREQAPQDAGRLTGTALAQMIEWHDFPAMAGLAMEHRKQSGSDEVLIAFLKNAPQGSKQQILELAGEISDPVAREEITRRFGD